MRNSSHPVRSTSSRISLGTGRLCSIALGPKLSFGSPSLFCSSLTAPLETAPGCLRSRRLFFPGFFFDRVGRRFCLRGLLGGLCVLRRFVCFRTCEVFCLTNIRHAFRLPP